MQKPIKCNDISNLGKTDADDIGLSIHFDSNGVKNQINLLMTGTNKKL